MSAYSIDSSVNTLTASQVWNALALAAGVFQYVEVVNLDGAATVTYRIGHTDPTNPTSEGADSWVLPAAVSSRVHDLSEPGRDPTAGLYVDVISGGTPKVAVTAW